MSARDTHARDNATQRPKHKIQHAALQDVRHGLKSADLFGVWKVIRAQRDSRNINPISIGTSTFTQHQCAEGAVAAVLGPAGNGTTATRILPRGQKPYSKKVPFFEPPNNAKQTHGPQTVAALRPPKWTQRGIKRSIFFWQSLCEPWPA